MNSARVLVLQAHGIFLDAVLGERSMKGCLDEYFSLEKEKSGSGSVVTASKWCGAEWRKIEAT
jgi:hypothetical protein